MTDDRAARQHAVFIKLRRTGLTHHFIDGRNREIAVILCMRVEAGVVAAVILVVGQINVDLSVEQVQRLDTFVAARVVNDREGKAFVPGKRERADDLRHIVCTCNEIDVGGAFALKREKGGGETFLCNHSACGLSAADGTILAEYAAKRAV